MRHLLTLALLLLAGTAYGIDSACTQTPNLSIYRCPANSRDWFASYTGIVDELDALAKTAKSSFTALAGFHTPYGVNASTVAASTVTISGTGSKCLSVDDPTLIVDCNFNTVGLGAAPPSNRNLFIYSASPAITLESSTSGEDMSFVKSQASGGGINWQNNNGWANLGAFTEAGRLGIGTITPATLLHMSSGTLTVDGTGASINIGANSSYKIQGLDVVAYNGTDITVGNAGGGGTQDIRFATGGNIRMTIADNATIPTGGALCLNASGVLSKCTSAVDASGNCTCP